MFNGISPKQPDQIHNLDHREKQAALQFGQDPPIRGVTADDVRCVLEAGNNEIQGAGTGSDLPALGEVPDVLREEASNYADYNNTDAAMAYRHAADLVEAVLEQEDR